MLLYRNESVAAQRNIPFILVDSSDGYTQRSGIVVVAGNIKISKNGGVEANHSGVVTEVGGGTYYYQATSGELDTLGYLQARITPSGCRTFNALAQVCLVNPYVGTLTANDIPTIVDQTWDEIIGPGFHYTTRSAGEALYNISAISVVNGIVQDNSPTATSFVTNLASTTNDFYNDQLLIFTNGNLNGQSKPVSDYTSGRLITLDEPLTSAPSSGDTFVLWAYHIHPVSQIATAVTGVITPVYYADINFTVDTNNSRDEYTVSWYKNGVPLPSSSISSPTLQVVKRADGTDLIASTSMQFISTSIGTIKKDESSNRLGTGEAGIAVVQAVIDGATQTWRKLFSRDN